MHHEALSLLRLLPYAHFVLLGGYSSSALYSRLKLKSIFNSGILPCRYAELIHHRHA